MNHTQLLETQLHLQQVEKGKFELSHQASDSDHTISELDESQSQHNEYEVEAGPQMRSGNLQSIMKTHQDIDGLNHTVSVHIK